MLIMPASHSPKVGKVYANVTNLLSELSPVPLFFDPMEPARLLCPAQCKQKVILFSLVLLISNIVFPLILHCPWLTLYQFSKPF